MFFVSLGIYDVYISVYYSYFFGFVGRSWSFLGLLPIQVSLIFSRLSWVFCRGFSWPPSVSCRYVSKTPLIFIDVFCDEFFTILLLRVSWSSIKRSGLLRHNKQEMLLVVIWVLLGSLLLRTESVYIRKQFNSHRIGLRHQHGRRDVIVMIIIIIIIMMMMMLMMMMIILAIGNTTHQNIQEDMCP